MPARKPAPPGVGLVVLFVYDLLAVKTAALQFLAHIVHHFFEAADIDVQGAEFFGSVKGERLVDVRLHSSGSPFPVAVRQCDGWYKAEALVLSVELFEFG